jgi:3',5'-nucleoside bisphosphate phosphatase
MPLFRVDLHIHTVLSPCGSLEMSPVNIVQAALKAKLDLIAITDHNSTKQAVIVRELAKESGLTVICGAEVTTKEEIHVLALFENDEQIQRFQQFIDENLTVIKNKPEYFGYQVVVDRNDQIIEEEERLLISALGKGIHEIEKVVHQLGGLFIPAHVDRPMNGIISHLGFIPNDLQCDAFGLSIRADKEKWTKSPLFPKNAIFIQNSDAHMPDQIGKAFTEIEMDKPTFQGLRNALKKEAYDRKNTIT